MTVSLGRVVDKAQDAYGVHENVVKTFVEGAAQLHWSMPRRIRDKARLEDAPLRWMNTLYTVHDHIDGVLQPVVNSLHDTHGEKQTPLRTVDTYRDAELQANYGTICETGLPVDLDDARQNIRGTVQSGQPVLMAQAREGQHQTIPMQLGHLENQTFEHLQEQLDEDIAGQAKKRAYETGATNMSKVKRGTLISPVHLYEHQVRGEGSLEKSEVQHRMANYFTLQRPDADNTDEAYERLRSEHDKDEHPYISYLFEAFEDITTSSPIDPARGIDW